MSSQLNSKRHFLDNLASLYMLWCDLQKFKPILQSNVIINILASKFVAWIQKHALSSSSFQISDQKVRQLNKFYKRSYIMILTNLSHTIKKLWEKISFHEHFKHLIPIEQKEYIIVLKKPVIHNSCILYLKIIFLRVQ